MLWKASTVLVAMSVFLLSPRLWGWMSSPFSTQPCALVPDGTCNPFSIFLVCLTVSSWQTQLKQKGYHGKVHGAPWRGARPSDGPSWSKCRVCSHNSQPPPLNKTKASASARGRAEGATAPRNSIFKPSEQNKGACYCFTPGRLQMPLIRLSPQGCHSPRTGSERRNLEAIWEIPAVTSCLIPVGMNKTLSQMHIYVFVSVKKEIELF